MTERDASLRRVARLVVDWRVVLAVAIAVWFIGWPLGHSGSMAPSSPGVSAQPSPVSREPSRSPSVAPATPTSSTEPLLPASTPFTGPEVDGFGLIDADHGWALSGNELSLTADGGLTWRPSLAIGPVGGQLRSGQVDFLGPQRGWVVPLRLDDTGPIAIERTGDGGQTWQQARIPSVFGISRGINFFDARHGLLALGGWAGTPGSLWATADGGATWTRTAAIPAAIVGPVVFSDAQTGWALAASEPNPPAGRPTLNELYVTHDGGLHWQRAVLPAPPAGWSMTEWQPMITALPSVFDPGEAVLAAWYGNGVRGTTQLLVTEDAGAHWRVAATIPSLLPVPVDALSATRWVAAMPSQGSAQPDVLEVTNDGGRTWRSLPEVAPGAGNYLRIDFADPLHGWVFDNGDVPLQLYATEDGGGHWRRLVPSAGFPTPTPACSVESVELSLLPALTPSADTPWFNVIVLNFDPSAPITISFDTPVLAWPGTPGATASPGTSYTIPAGAFAGGKFSFRPVTPGVTQVAIQVQGTSCAVSASVDLTSLPTATP